MKVFFIWLGIFLGVILIGEALQGLDLVNFQFWGAKYATAQRNIYEKSPSYVEGHISDLRNGKFQYDTTKDANKKAAILGYERGNLEKLDPEDVPSDLKDFYNTVQGNQ